LQEITIILGANPEEINLDDDSIPNEDPVSQANGNGHPGVAQKLIDQQHAEILFLKETINFQWQLLNDIVKKQITGKSSLIKRLHNFNYPKTRFRYKTYSSSCTF